MNNSRETTRLRASGIAILASVALFGTACSGSTPSSATPDTGGSGEMPSGGGANPTGGASSVGGSTSVATGGASPVGGAAPASGGVGAVGGGVGTGGTSGPATGGNTQKGGSLATGGSTALVAGGSFGVGGTGTSNAGGTKATTGGSKTGGGNSATGGVPATGGSQANAGTAATGGTPSAGGSKATGGASAAGGTTSTGSCAVPASGHYQMEDLDRGVVAVKVSGGVYVGWRMMGYEYNRSSPSSVSFNVYKGGTKLANVTDSTNYLDAAGTTTSSYSVSAVINGTECPQSPAVTPWAQNYLSIPLAVPPTSATGATYSANDGSPGDLDGDGKLDIVLKWDPSDAKDNSQSGTTSNVYLDGYTLAGKHLWRIDLGPNIRAGAHYTQFSVYDFNGDGRAEVACKTAPGTKDGTGAYLSTGPAANDSDSTLYANSDGYILTGPEYLTVFDGATGKELATIDYPVPRGTVSSWGDSYGNRVDRFNGGFAFVKDNGTATGLPSIIQGRGYYTRLTVSALTFRKGTLAKNWIYDSVSSLNSNGAGDHSEMAADTDGDLGQEIITGQTTISSSGALQCQTGMGHGDAMDVGELVPGKGISVFSIHEGEGGMDAHDGATCAFYFKTTESGVDSNRGRGEYVGTGDENSASCSCSSCDEKLALCATGATTGPSAGSNFVIYWDADEWRELEDGTSITKGGTGASLLSASGCASNNGTKSTPTLTADLLGDWREEIVYRTSDNTALRVYTTTNVTARRIYTLMHDPTYRAQVSFEQSAYNQPPHPGFRISPNMTDPPTPNIYVR